MRRTLPIRSRVIYTDTISEAKVEFRIKVTRGTLTEVEAKEVLRATVRRTADVVQSLPRVDLGIDQMEVRP